MAAIIIRKLLRLAHTPTDRFMINNTDKRVSWHPQLRLTELRFHVPLNTK